MASVRIEESLYDAFYFDDPGATPLTPPTGYSLKPAIEQWLRDNGGCDGWRPVYTETESGVVDLVLEIQFSVPETAARFRERFIT